jgi:hypothetical protein
LEGIVEGFGGRRSEEFEFRDGVRGKTEFLNASGKWREG